MDEPDYQRLQEGSPQTYLGLPSLQQPLSETNNQLQSTHIIDKYQNSSLNQAFDNQFDQNPPQKFIYEQKTRAQQKYTENSSIKYQTNEEKKSRIKEQKSKKSKRSSSFLQQHIIKQSNQAFLTDQSQDNGLLIGVTNKKQDVKTKENTINQTQIERKVKQIAKQIRQKVKRESKQSKNINKQQKNVGKPQSTNKLQQRDIILSPINNKSIRFSPSKLLTFQEESQNSNIKQMVKQLINKQIIGKMWETVDRQQRISKYKLKLDPIKHKYPLTVFRKAILKQDKLFYLEEQKRLKEREEKLLQRRQIYNSSRYDRYIKHQKHKKGINERENQTQELILLKRQDNASFLESMENPEEKIKENTIGVFPIKTQQGETIQVKSFQQREKEQEPDSSYNQDFF